MISRPNHQLNQTYTFPKSGTYTIYVHSGSNGAGINAGISCNNAAVNIMSQVIGKYSAPGWSYMLEKYVLSNVKQGDTATIISPSATSGQSAGGSCLILSGDC